MEFDYVTNQYLYPDRYMYIKMIHYFLNIFSEVVDPELLKGGLASVAPQKEGPNPEIAKISTILGLKS
jgi:hypothetical protein